MPTPEEQALAKELGEKAVGFIFSEETSYTEVDKSINPYKLLDQWEKTTASENYLPEKQKQLLTFAAFLNPNQDTKNMFSNFFIENIKDTESMTNVVTLIQAREDLVKEFKKSTSQNNQESRTNIIKKTTALFSAMSQIPEITSLENIKAAGAPMVKDPKTGIERPTGKVPLAEDIFFSTQQTLDISDKINVVISTETQKLTEKAQKTTLPESFNQQKEQLSKKQKEAEQASKAAKETIEENKKLEKNKEAQKKEQKKATLEKEQIKNQLKQRQKTELDSKNLLNHEITNIRAKKQETETQIKRLEEQITTHQTAIKRLEGQEKTQPTGTHPQESIKNKIPPLTETLNKDKQKLATLKGDLDKQNASLNKKGQELKDKDNRIKELKKETENLSDEKIPPTVKTKNYTLDEKTPAKNALQKSMEAAKSLQETAPKINTAIAAQTAEKAEREKAEKERLEKQEADKREQERLQIELDYASEKTSTAGNFKTDEDFQAALRHKSFQSTATQIEAAVSSASTAINEAQKGKSLTSEAVQAAVDAANKAEKAVNDAKRQIQSNKTDLVTAKNALAAEIQASKNYTVEIENDSTAISNDAFSKKKEEFHEKITESSRMYRDPNDINDIVNQTEVLKNARKQLAADLSTLISDTKKTRLETINAGTALLAQAKSALNQVPEGDQKKLLSKQITEQEEQLNELEGNTNKAETMSTIPAKPDNKQEKFLLEAVNKAAEDAKVAEEAAKAEADAKAAEEAAKAEADAKAAAEQAAEEAEQARIAAAKAAEEAAAAKAAEEPQAAEEPKAAEEAAKAEANAKAAAEPQAGSAAEQAATAKVEAEAAQPQAAPQPEPAKPVEPAPIATTPPEPLGVHLDGPDDLTAVDTPRIEAPNFGSTATFTAPDLSNVNLSDIQTQIIKNERKTSQNPPQNKPEKNKWDADAKTTVDGRLPVATLADDNKITAHLNSHNQEHAPKNPPISITKPDAKKIQISTTCCPQGDALIAQTKAIHGAYQAAIKANGLPGPNATIDFHPISEVNRDAVLKYAHEQKAALEAVGIPSDRIKFSDGIKAELSKQTSQANVTLPETPPALTRLAARTKKATKHASEQLDQKQEQNTPRPGPRPGE